MKQKPRLHASVPKPKLPNAPPLNEPQLNVPPRSVPRLQSKQPANKHRPRLPLKKRAAMPKHRRHNKLLHRPQNRHASVNKRKPLSAPPVNVHKRPSKLPANTPKRRLQHRRPNKPVCVSKQRHRPVNRLNARPLNVKQPESGHRRKPKLKPNWRQPHPAARPVTLMSLQTICSAANADTGLSKKHSAMR